MPAPAPVVTPGEAVTPDEGPKIEIEEKKIVMYYRPTCYYCIKVKRILDELKIPVVYKDISDIYESKLKRNAKSDTAMKILQEIYPLKVLLMRPIVDIQIFLH